jgi:hypothetical protein
MLADLEGLNLRELRHVRETFLAWRRRQPTPNPEIENVVVLTLTIAANADPGVREIRLRAQNGVTNPLSFHVGTLRETFELEPNEEQVWPPLPEEPPLEAPILVNGQVMHDDVDRFTLRAKEGQHLVIRAQARSLMPYLADAVPGWFQAVLTLFDRHGKEIAFRDDFRFDPDPVLYFEVPQDGDYTLELRDAIYRGRQDFVYRLAITEEPFVTSVFPLGLQAGTEVAAAIDGWNLSQRTLPLKAGDVPGIYETAVITEAGESNLLRYAVDTLPECVEAEANATQWPAQKLDFPCIVNGRIAQPGDVDLYCFQGKAGEKVVAEIVARRLWSPLDAVIWVTDSAGEVVAWNDDHENKAAGLETHHADPYLITTLPSDGTYFVKVADVQQQGGPAYAYRLRLSTPRPDFELRVSPATMNAYVGRAEPITLHAVRRDGFNGAIKVSLGDAPEGFMLSGGLIPAGQNEVRATLTMPGKRLQEPVAVRMEGRAERDGETISRTVYPCEDRMQAFLWRHLALTQEFLVSVQGDWEAGEVPHLPDDYVVPLIRPGTSATARVGVPNWWEGRGWRVELVDGPEGISVEPKSITNGIMTVLVGAEAGTAPGGLAGNLLIDVIMEPWLSKEEEEAGVEKPWSSQGLLPAVPFEIARQ